MYCYNHIKEHVFSTSVCKKGDLLCTQLILLEKERGIILTEVKIFS